MALERLTSFTFGTRFLTLVYGSTQTFYVSYAHLIGFESDPRSGDLTIWIYTAGEVSETLSVKNSDLVAIGSSASAFLALLQGVLVNQLFWFEIWANFLARAKANSALTPELASTCGRYFRYELNPPLVPTATEDYADFWYFNQRCDNDSATVKEVSAYNCLLTRFSALNPN
jgi:hypothetical protein